VVAKATSQVDAAATGSRRQVVQAAAALLLASLAGARPAAAGLFGDDTAADAKYADDTASVLAGVKAAMAFSRDDPALAEKVKKVRDDINTWVARYRRNTKYGGRPSYSNTYSVCNALAGHYNSFGNEAAIPKKRLERMVKELADAELLLSRGR